MVRDLNDRMGGAICNKHIVGSDAHTKLIKIQNLHDTWRNVNPEKSEFTYHRIQSNIHSRLNRIYARQNITILNSKIITFQHLDHEVSLTEFVLRVRARGPGYWKLNSFILTHETFKIAFKNFWHDGQQQKNSYDQLSTWWEIGKFYLKMLATHYCVMKNIRNKQEELTQFITTEKTKQNPDQIKINKAQQHP